MLHFLSLAGHPHKELDVLAEKLLADLVVVGYCLVIEQELVVFPPLGADVEQDVASHQAALRLELGLLLTRHLGQVFGKAKVAIVFSLIQQPAHLLLEDSSEPVHADGIAVIVPTSDEHLGVIVVIEPLRLVDVAAATLT